MCSTKLHLVKQSINTKSVERFPLDKLAELDSVTESVEKGVLFRRARAKYVSAGLALKLAQIDSPLKKSYWNTFYCCRTLVKHHDTEEKITAKYCKNRWCLVCSRIRSAETIKEYVPILEAWTEKYMVTLTVPNVRAEALEATIKKMELDFFRVRKLMTYRKFPFVGIKKLEVTYNPDRNDYHPHFHFVVKGKAAAEELLKQWLERNPNAREIAQDVRLADNDSVRELCKYFTKILSGKPEKNAKNGGRKIAVAPLDVIFRTVKGKRTFQNFGFKLPKKEQEVRPELQAENERYIEHSFYEWSQEITDWVNIETGETLTDYKPHEAFRSLVENIDDAPLRDVDLDAFLKRPPPEPPPPEPVFLEYDVSNVLDAIMN